MRALCPDCGFHHEVVRTLEDGHGDLHRDIYQVASLGDCKRTYITDRELFEARARFGAEAIVEGGEDEDAGY
jgi:hypothetical protein